MKHSANSEFRHIRSDVVIAGYGPTGMVLAALLGQKGITVTVLERYESLYTKPRAAAFDDETMRTFQQLGIAEKVLGGTNVQNGYVWVNGKGQVLTDFEYDNPGPNGWPAQYMMYQPHLEDVLDKAVRSIPNVQVIQGATVTELEDFEESVHITALATDGQQITVEADFVVGADGGNSFVRQSLGIDLDSYDFSENWLVCDFKLRHEVAGLPTFQQVCNPEEPIAIVNIGPGYHRFSFRLEPDADRDAIARPENVWPRVSDYLTQKDAELIRVANYTFQSAIATQWRRGRVLLAGDAAHQMPPFLAQGMVSGIRDARNLAWKIEAVLRGAPETLLDTFQEEREPHVRFITEKAIELGKVQTMRDKIKAEERDRTMMAAHAARQRPDKFRYPPISGRMITDNGGLFPQGFVSGTNRSAMFDDIAGTSWQVVVTQPSLLRQLPDTLRERFTAMGGKEISFGITSMLEGAPLSDTGGVYTRWFSNEECIAAVVRPDRHIYGTARSADELTLLLEKLTTSDATTKTLTYQ